MAKDFSSNASYPIGMRNDNPGNLRPSGLIPWLGSNGSNGGFVRFKDMSYGLRAMAIDLTNKVSKDKLDTLSEIISKYAPESENDTASYINAVAAYTGWNPDTQIVLTGDNLLKLMRAQINVEQGVAFSQMLSDDDLKEGISMMPSGLLDYIGGFFAANSITTTVLELGLAAIVVVIIILLIKHKKINLENAKNLFK